MGILLFFVKPALYLVAFAVAYSAFQAHAPHLSMGGKPVGKWALIFLAAVTRIIVGVPGGLLAVTVVKTESLPLFAAMILPLGTIMFFGVGVLAFPKTPAKKLVVFALLAEAVIGAIDLWAWHDVSTISFC